jgi:hypothetical protein
VLKFSQVEYLAIFWGKKMILYIEKWVLQERNTPCQCVLQRAHHPHGGSIGVMATDNKKKIYNNIDCDDPYPRQRACKVAEVNLPTNI